jgi:hypothetical protein
MSLYVLDTDHISLQQRGVEPLFSRVNALPPDRFLITAVSIEETFRGRLAQIKQAKKEEEQIVAYRWLIETTRWINRFRFAGFDAAAKPHFHLASAATSSYWNHGFANCRHHAIRWRDFADAQHR